MVYLVCYDITDDAIRLGVARILSEYGDRVQRSVFEVRVRSEADLYGLIERLKDTAEDDCDVRMYRLCRNCRQTSQTLTGEAVAVFPATIIV
ncbi:MAG: CRISPR-associated endonuclease Cas2 [Gammaproteobacteria bacterium]